LLRLKDKQIVMAKFTLHFEDGSYAESSSRSKDKLINECNDMKSKGKVCEEYIAPSPFSGKPSKHAREVYRNY